MKRILLVLISMLSFGLNAEKNEMIPLNDFLEGKESLDDSEALYLTYRCMGLYSMLFGLTKDADNEGSKELNADIMIYQSILLSVSETLYNRLTFESLRDFTTNMKDSVQPIVDNYQLEANASWVNQGIYLNDYIIADGEICRFFTDQFTEQYLDGVKD